MENYFNLLKKVIKKPDKIYNPGNEELWLQFQNKNGIIFPNDYKDMINYYGTGGINNFLWFLTPFAKDENVNYMYRSKQMLEAYKESKISFPDDFPYNIFPEKDGLLPWGYTDNGDELYWQTSKNIEEWKIVVYESRSTICYSYHMGLAEFLYKLLSKQIVCDIFPDDLFDAGIEYFAISLY